MVEVRMKVIPTASQARRWVFGARRYGQCGLQRQNALSGPLVASCHSRVVSGCIV